MNWNEVREQFPVVKEHIFFDLANKCPLPLFSTKTIIDYIQKQQEFGGDKDEWFRTIDEARLNVGKLINADPEEIAFLKNTSEGLNMCANGIPFKPGDNIIINYNEHPNNIFCWQYLESRGVEVRWAPTRDGEVLLEDLIKMVDKSTRCIALAYVNFAPGNRNDIKSIAQFCKDNNIYSVIDGVQAVGTINVDVKDLGVDMLCTSGHKALFVPHGVGILYVRKDIIKDIKPSFVARSSMEKSVAIEHDNLVYKLNLSDTARCYEIGNFNYLGITVLNESVKYLLSIGMENIEKRILELNEYLTKKLISEGITVVGLREGSLRSAIICFKSEDPQKLHKHLMENDAITTCRRDSTRVSLGIYNNEEDVDKFVDLVKNFTI